MGNLIKYGLSRVISDCMTDGTQGCYMHDPVYLYPDPFCNSTCTSTMMMPSLTTFVISCKMWHNCE